MEILTCTSYLNIQLENHGYRKIIMQVAVVACLGMKNTSGRSVDCSRKDLSEVLLSRRGLIRFKGIMIIFTVGP